MFQKFGKKMKAATGTALAVVGASMYAPMALAAGESADIIAVFDEYKVEAILVIVALAVVLWTLRGAGLLKPRS